MNSWKSSEFWACAPPLTTFISGTGRTCALVPPSQRYSGRSASAAAAFATASETPRIAFAPRRDFVGVPSSSIMAPSSSRCSRASIPMTRSAISPLTCADGTGDALAEPGVAAVTELDGLVLSRRRSRRDRCGAESTRLEPDLDLDGRVAAGVENLACVDVDDRAHRHSLAASSRPVALPRSAAETAKQTVVARPGQAP